ncbi:glycosyltransferase, family 4 [Aliarcobacter cibarius]|uniref:glycosyltransferase n=1 Tax=Aliarcobacter cibarius TaxID=255507 RepID=UPI001245A0FA|nr:glycosyltransferase [Aliarcobacter cibarius]QEZ90031.1 glycosyltransferase, family 4 [Aliarcobacter cibarius]
MQDNNLKVLIVAHYFPPINSSGAKRFQYISKYFSESDLGVTVFTTKKTSSDGAFTEDIPDGVNVYEFDFIGNLSPSIEGNKEFVPLYSDKKSFFRKVKDVVMDLFGQLPDPRLPFAFSFFLRKSNNSINNVVNNTDIIIATSPPWSMMLAGFFLKRKYNKKLVLDYRDHFSYCHEMPGNFIAKKIEFVIDKWLVKNADAIVTISEPMKSYYSKFGKPTYVVSNGYDYDSMEKARILAQECSSDKVTIRYMGIVSDGRIPRNVIKALDSLRIKDNKKFNLISLEFYGNASLLKKYLENNYPNLINNFKFYDFVSYIESLKLIIESDYVLFSETSNVDNLSSQGILTTKLFEYLGSGRPVLADISSDTLAGSLILKCSNANLVSTDYNKFLEFFLEDNFYIRNKSLVSDEAKNYTRKNQALYYEKILKEIVNNEK